MFGSLALCALFFANSNPQGTLDPAFDKIPFEQWVQQRGPVPFRAQLTVSRAELTFHQRLLANVQIRMDGKDLQTRRHGELVFFVQITDSEGTRYRNHGAIDLTKLDENVKAIYVQYGYFAFFLPGAYRLSLVALDTETAEHAAFEMPFRITYPPSPLFANAWRDLPPVEFIADTESPDSWFLPGARGPVHWAEQAGGATRLNILLNVAASAPLPGARSTPSAGLNALLPTLKTMWQPNLSEQVEFIDLARHRAAFQQDGGALNWPKMKASLSDASTASIDVRSLSEGHKDAQYFVTRIRRLLRESPQPQVLVILTIAVAFQPGEDLTPISLEALPPSRVFYIRYHAPAPVRSPIEGPMQRPGRFGRGGEPMIPMRSPVIDQLAATLKPLNPRIVDVETPEQMANALSEIMKFLKP